MSPSARIRAEVNVDESAPGDYQFVVGLMTAHPWIQGETSGQKGHCRVRGLRRYGCRFEIQVTPTSDLRIGVWRAQVVWLESLREEAQARRVTEVLDFSRVWCTTCMVPPYHTGSQGATSLCVHGDRSEYLTLFCINYSCRPLGEWAAGLDKESLTCPT